MHGFCTVVIFAGRFCNGRNCLKMCVGFCIRSAEPDDIGDNEVLDGGKIGFVGLGCPLVLAALLGQPVHKELCHRHRGRNQESTSRQLMLDLFFSARCLLFCRKAFPFVAVLAVLIFVGVEDSDRACL